MHGFVDLQINGVQGVDFNSTSLSRDDWDRALQALRNDGTEAFLPTVITDSIPALIEKLDRLASLCEPDGGGSIEGGSRPVGIHLEGPFLSAKPGYIGAHPKAHAKDASLEEMKRLYDAARGWLKLVTLAPERDEGGKVTRWLVDQGVLVAAGHTDASVDQLKRGIDSGLSLFTHLGNACPPTVPRHDNIVHRVIALRDSLMITLIADGHHLPLWLLESWVRVFGLDRVAIVSDAISAALLPPGLHRLGDQVVAVGDDGVPRSEDRTHFVGSGATLGMMAGLLRRETAMSEAELVKMFCENPRRWLHIA
ncbi:MAG: N-acetylglucosamine-6-phosphate deacetylase [Pirellula sp.]|jgi:N-acetylglucosamine-6-phosphate deacetylase